LFWQRTIRRTTSSTGIGLHSGKRVKMVLKPAPPNTGVVFRRTDLENFEIRATEEYLYKTDHATSLSRDKICIDTVEHLMASLLGTGVDNIIVEMDSSEVPAMDGSASPFIYLVKEAGIKKLPRKRQLMKINKPIEIRNDGKFIALYPSDSFRITYRIEFNHPSIGSQEASFEIDEKSFIEEIAPARTFGFLKEVELMRRNNLGRGGSLDNAVILDEHKIINNPLRFEDEFVRHKILDAVGDMAFLRHRILGHLVASRAGHTMHIRLVNSILNQPDCWELLSESSYEEMIIDSAKKARKLSLA
jgi:UDP-3-O-[3-hydroxymyristoyl] N-acetylglucosamine deacetylase